MPAKINPSAQLEPIIKVSEATEEEELDPEFEEENQAPRSELNLTEYEKRVQMEFAGRQPSIPNCDVPADVNNSVMARSTSQGMIKTSFSNQQNESGRSGNTLVEGPSESLSVVVENVDSAGEPATMSKSSINDSQNLYEP